MSTRKRVQTKPSRSLLDYSKAAQAQQVARQESRQVVGEDVVMSALESLLKAKSYVGKEELETWAKVRGYPISVVMKAMNDLVSMGRVVKRLNDEGVLVYVWRG